MRRHAAKIIWAGMAAFIALTILAFSSCVMYSHEAQSKNGKRERDLLVSLGGTSTMKGADGSTFTHDHQASFKDGVQGATAIAAGFASASVTKAKNASDAATAQQAQKQAAALAHEKQAADAAHQAAQDAQAAAAASATTGGL